MARSSSKRKRWVATVQTDSTHPPAQLFTKRAPTIARTLASKKVSPKGPGSGMRMLTYFINRAGRGLSAAQGTGKGEGAAFKTRPARTGIEEAQVCCLTLRGPS